MDFSCFLMLIKRINFLEMSFYFTIAFNKKIKQSSKQKPLYCRKNYAVCFFLCISKNRALHSYVYGKKNFSFTVLVTEVC